MSNELKPKKKIPTLASHSIFLGWLFLTILLLLVCGFIYLMVSIYCNTEVEPDFAIYPDSELLEIFHHRSTDPMIRGFKYSTNASYQETVDFYDTEIFECRISQNHEARTICEYVGGKSWYNYSVYIDGVDNSTIITIDASWFPRCSTYGLD